MYRKNKYGNIRVAVDGRNFDSKSEATHSLLLKSMMRATNDSDRVVEILYQYKFPIDINGKHICNYIADFYVTFADGHKEIQDVKGMRTAVYLLKKKMVEAQYGQKIIEF